MDGLRDTANFAKGVGEGVWDGVTGMVKGVASVAKEGYALATDPDARREARHVSVEAAHEAAHVVHTALTDPGRAGRQVAHKATDAFQKLGDSSQQAKASGRTAEFAGEAVGQVIALVGTAVVPGVAGAKLAAAVGETGRLAEAAGAIGDAARLAKGAQRSEKIVTEASALRAAAAGDTTTAYRVDGVANRRVLIDEHGNVEIPRLKTRKGAERNLNLNFSDEERARTFHQQRLAQFPDSETRRFNVHTSFVDELRAHAVPEIERSRYPQHPVIADPTKAADQLGLPGPWIGRLREQIVPQRGMITYAAGANAAPGAADDAAVKALWNASTRQAADIPGPAAHPDARSAWAASVRPAIDIGSRTTGIGLAATGAAMQAGTAAPSHAPAAGGAARDHSATVPAPTATTPARALRR